MSAPPAPDFACEPCDVGIPRNCGHFWVTRSLGMTCVTCVTSPIEIYPESSWNNKAVSTREAGTQTEPWEAAEGAVEPAVDRRGSVKPGTAAPEPKIRPPPEV